MTSLSRVQPTTSSFLSFCSDRRGTIAVAACGITLAIALGIIRSRKCRNVRREKIALLSKVSILEPTGITSLSRSQILECIKAAATVFKANQTSPIPSLTVTACKDLFTLAKKSHRFFGIHKKHQESLLLGDFRQNKLFLKDYIFKHLELNRQTKILQVIGDSAVFSPAATKTAQEYLERFLNADESLVLWGYTGHVNKDTGAKDTNQLVNDWLDANSDRPKRTLANIVDFHTPQAIESWNSSILTSNRNFYMVYGDAKFGDDIISSDLITDSAVVLEGGIQTFRQMMNLLLFDLQIHCIYNIRNKIKPVVSSFQYEGFFSATEFLDLLAQYIKTRTFQGFKIAEKDMEEFKNNYLRTHFLFDPKKPDASTKQNLFDAAWRLFIQERLWTKVSNCHITRVPDELKDGEKAVLYVLD